MTDQQFEGNTSNLSLATNGGQVVNTRFFQDSTKTGGPTGGGPVNPNDYVTKEHLALTVDAVRSQIDARFAEMEGKISGLSSRNDLIVLGLALAALVVGVLAFGGDRFDGGVQVSSATAIQAAETQALAKQNAEAISELTENTNAMLRVIELKSEAPEER